MRRAAANRAIFPSDRDHDHTFSLRELAHELNSLLDGSMRYLDTARQSLEQAAVAGGSTDETARRLDAAHEGMRSMATLLDHALKGDSQLMHHDRFLGDEIRRIVAACAAKAEQAGVSVELHLDEAAANIPIGPLGPVVLNGLRNAIEACADAVRGTKAVEISIGITGHDRLEMLIADTGTGVVGKGVSTKASGHGIGLELSRRIVRSVGGSIELMSVPFGGGAVLRMLVPLHRLHRA